MVGSRRVCDIAKELNRNSKELVEVLRGLGIDAKAANSAVAAEDEARLRAHLFGVKGDTPAPGEVSVAAILKPMAGARLRKKAPAEKKEEAAAVPAGVPAEAPAEPAEPSARAEEPPAPAAAAPAAKAAEVSAEKAAAPAGREVSAEGPKAAPAAPEQPAEGEAAAAAAAAKAPAKGKKPGGPRVERFDLRARLLEEIESERGEATTTDAVRAFAGEAERPAGRGTRAPAGKGAKTASPAGRPAPPMRRSGPPMRRSGPPMRRPGPPMRRPAPPARRPAPPAAKPAPPGLPPRRAIPQAVRHKTAPKAKPAEPKAPPAKKKIILRGDATAAELALALDAAQESVAAFFLETEQRAVTPLTLLTAEEQTAAANALGFDATAQPRAEEVRPRAPVVAVLGHVDHGKTTLLDAIRKTNVVATESGGITQHIGASIVRTGAGDIVFIDTPGHEVFTQMRARGAQVTDIVVLVVAADDGVMPQTVESINHARAAEVPLVVAITKVDKAGTDPLRVKKQLADLGVTTEDWGGDVLAVEVAPPRGEGLTKLLEAIALQAEIMELRGDVSARPEGVVLESTLDRGRGAVMTVLINRGVLKVGDAFIVGSRPGRVRAMFDAAGKPVKEAGPAVPVTVLGAEGIPGAGDQLLGMPSDKTARTVGALLVVEPTAEPGRETTFSLDEWYEQMQAGGKRELSLVLKADVAGSLEALAAQCERLGNDEVAARVLHAGVGAVNEGDILLAAASQGIVIAFRTGVEPKAKALARREGVEIRPYDVIYEVIADVRAALEGLLEPTIVLEVVGTAEVRQVFEIGGGRVAGSMVRTGRAARGATARVRRGDAVVYEGAVASLRRFRDDVKEVQQGFECGIQLAGFNEPEPGDVIEFLEERRVARRLTSR